ncbi:protein TIFY 5B [Eucalyptus grandis]|nr:protein TIFY 5B [Eucalyptus grandis]
MRRSCNWQLSLQSASASLSPMDFHHRDRHPDQMEVSSRRQEEQQQLTIFYDGHVCVCDVTELQARAILVLASREMQERMKATPTVTSWPNSPSRTSPSAELYSPTGTGLSMKRSLQRFLQKRKLRFHATSPYHTDQ